MHNKLRQIYQSKIAELKNIPVELKPERSFPLTSFREKVEGKNSLSLIAEIKKTSPSKGLLRTNFDLLEIAKAYADFPADAISVLTDYEYFQGDKCYIGQVKKITNIPVLRKDFIIDERQITESYNLGADIILLIVAMLSNSQLTHLILKGKSLGMDVLVETHTADEIESALISGADIIGINNRDLNTFKVDINTSLNLIKYVPTNIIKVAESGIYSADDIKKMNQAGFDAVLIGEAFMIRENLHETYKALFK
jgi:indole-3-glycerol phosphate synthase